MVEAAEAVGSDEVEVVILNDATPLLRYRALRDDIRLLDPDPRMRVRLERDALLEYLDTAPLRAPIAAGVRRRIADGPLVDAESITERLARLEHWLSSWRRFARAGKPLIWQTSNCRRRPHRPRGARHLSGYIQVS
jgi:hypothetical protein